MAKLLNRSEIIGKKYGTLTVIDIVPHSKNNCTQLVCQCECGITKTFRKCNLDQGQKSCGCKLNEMRRIAHTKHGMVGSREYRSWHSAKRRCYSISNIGYHDYGGRGIIMCDRWKDSFSNFLQDMGPRPENTSLERMRVDGNYEPGNCKWATPTEQMNNTRRTKLYRYGDSEKSMAQWATELNIDYYRLYFLVKLKSIKMSFEDAVKIATAA